MAARALATAFVNIVPGTVELEKYLKKELGDDVAKAGNTAGNSFAKGTGKGFKSSIGASLRPALGIMAASFAAVKIKDFMSEAVTGALEAQKVDAALDQIAKTTALFGDQTSIVTDRLKDFATEQMKLTGIDDEVIKKGQAKLLTFKRIGDSAGEMGGAFDRATVLMQDLAAAGFGNVESNAVLLGKALNDPIKGMAALRRVGVSLTSEQEDQVKAFMAVNDIAAAQSIILGEVESQVGGTAAASATATEKMKARWDDLKDSLGTTVAPAFENIADVISDKVLPQLEDFIKWVDDNPDKVKAFAGVMGGLAAAIGAAAIAQWSLNAALLVSPIGLAVGVVAALGGALYYAWQNSAGFRETMGGLFADLQEFWVKYGPGITTAIKILLDSWLFLFSSTWSTIATVISVALKLIENTFMTMYYLFTGKWGKIPGLWAETFSSIGKSLKTWLVSQLKTVSKFVGGLAKALDSDFLRGIQNSVNDVVGSIQGSAKIQYRADGMPKLADGGFVTRPTTALIGEAGPEVVTPLRDFERMMGMDQKSDSARPIQVGGKTVAWLQELVDGRAEIVVNGAFAQADQYGRQFV